MIDSEFFGHSHFMSALPIGPAFSRASVVGRLIGRARRYGTLARPRRAVRTALGLFLLCAGTFVQVGARAEVPREGQWVLNPERSRGIAGKQQILWIIRSHGGDFAFAIGESSNGGPITVVAWSGKFDGVTRPVAGAPLVLAVAAGDGDVDLLIRGRTEDGRAIEERCQVLDEGLRLRCVGSRSAPSPGGSPEEYVEDYDWRAANPVLLGGMNTNR